MVRAEVSGEIDRSAEEVFAYVTDPVRFREWNSTVLESLAEPPGPLQVGSKIHIVSGFMGRRIAFTAEVTEFVPNVKCVTRVSQPFALERTDLIEPLAFGTRVTIRGIAELRGVLKAIELFLGPLARRTYGRQIAALRKQLEVNG